MHWRNHRVGQIGANASADQQEPGKGSDRTGDVGRRRAGITTGAPDEECVDVGQTQLAAGLVGTLQVLEELANLVELLADRDLGVAPMLSQVGTIVAQDRRDRLRTAFDGPPWWHWHANDLIDAVQRAH
ncbi:hypothetical protein PAMC26577_34850 [Caballeronia sordidicola]|uniref:Uncharacterized protein n=1 Tax=Caballeronia sordidicola TaxID=196367 RepID=A0A242MA65_CABSO|nr:hypothetical protein [Caballeronia sordidicola]OTP68080.1 hypothetical protein PAMC26577_34850 [Caballeronia sordidicola]